MANHPAAERAARRIAGRTHLPGPFSIARTEEIIEAAIDEATSEQERTVAALEDGAKILHEELATYKLLVRPLRMLLEFFDEETYLPNKREIAAMAQAHAVLTSLKDEGNARP